jgi:hypothetical protein
VCDVLLHAIASYVSVVVKDYSWQFLQMSVAEEVMHSFAVISTMRSAAQSETLHSTHIISYDLLYVMYLLREWWSLFMAQYTRAVCVVFLIIIIHVICGGVCHDVDFVHRAAVVVVRFIFWLRNIPSLALTFFVSDFYVLCLNMPGVGR